MDVPAPLTTRLSAVVTVDGRVHRFCADGDPTVVVVAFRSWLATLPAPKDAGDVDALDRSAPETVWSGAKERTGEVGGLSGTGGIGSSLSDAATIGKG